jgi:hypothetical protein
MPLPPETLPAVPHIVFSFFNLAVPDLVAVVVVFVLFVAASWARLPRFFEPPEEGPGETS